MTTDSQTRREWAALRLEASHAELVSAEEEPALIERANAGERAAMARLTDSHRRIVVEVAARYARPGIPPRDLVGEGVVGLLEAIHRCKPGHGARLSTYARWWIRARVRAYALANRRIVGLPTTRAGRRTVAQLARAERTLLSTLGRAPTRSELAHMIGVDESDVEAVVSALASRDVALGAPGEDPGNELSGLLKDPEQLLEEAEQHACLQRELARLPGRERAVLDAQLIDDELTFGQLARTLGVSSQRTSQIAAAARERLRRALPAAS